MLIDEGCYTAVPSPPFDNISSITCFNSLASLPSEYHYPLPLPPFPTPFLPSVHPVNTPTVKISILLVSTFPSRPPTVMNIHDQATRGTVRV